MTRWSSFDIEFASEIDDLDIVETIPTLTIDRILCQTIDVL